MGVSQSKDEDYAAGQRKSINNNCNRVLVEDVSERSRDNYSSSSTMSSTNSRLRMIIPKRRQSKRKTAAQCSSAMDDDTKSTNSSSASASSAASPIVASFKTTLSTKFNNMDSNILNSYPRSTTILAPLGGINSNPDHSSNGSRWTSSTRTRSGRPSMVANLNIPSPVPSVSEHSEDNLSIENEDENANPDRETTVKNQNSMQTTTSFTDRPNIRSISSCVAKSSSSNDVANTYLRSNIPNIVQTGKKEISITEDQILPSVHGQYPTRVSTIPKKQDQFESKKIVNSQSLMGNNNQVASSLSNTANKSTTMAECRMKRPNTLSPYQPSGIRSIVARVGVGKAPLAESECFVIENSPAVEFPPSRGPTIIPNAKIDPQASVSPTVSSIDSGEKDSGYAGLDDTPKRPENRISMGTTALQSTRMQSRLKNPNIYLNRQRGIYTSAPLPSFNGDLEASHVADTKEKKRCDSLAINTTATDSDDSRADTSSESLGKPTNFSPGLNLKEEVRDSGIKLDSICDSVANDSSLSAVVYEGKGTKTNGSPESLHRGLIDDEIRDQPDLTIACTSPEKVDPQGRSRASTMKSEASDRSVVGECGGPIRVKERIRKRSSNRMTESYESTMSSLSIDSEDMMLDFDGIVDATGEECDSITNALDSASIYSSLGRRRSRNTSGSGTGSWGRRKVKNLAGVGTRASLEAVIDEWSSLKSGVEKGSQVHTQRQYSSSDVPPSTSSVVTTTGSSRILKPPVTVESTGLALVNLDQQTYRHVVQDVTVMKTMLLRLKRVLQDAETSNPFENAINSLNGVLKQTSLDSDVQKADYASPESTNEALKSENRILRNQIAMLVQQLEDQSRVIQCLQQQLKQCRRHIRKSDITDDSFPEESGSMKGSVFNEDIYADQHDLKGEDASTVML